MVSNTRKKRSLEDIFILQQLQKIKDAKYYTQPIFTPEEWKERYPHESEAEIPSYIPCWRDLDEIIYQKEGHSPYQKMHEEKV